MAAPPETRADDGQPPPSPRLARKSAGAAVLAAAAAVKASFASWDLALLRDKLREADLYVEHSRLVVRKSLGSGAFASTRHAELRQGGGRVREVAVKTLRPELVHDPEQIALFAKEVDMLRVLKHRHIVEFIGCSWSSQGPEDSSRMDGTAPLFFVQEYCAGGSLGDLVRRQMIRPYKPLYSDADALRWCQHIASALQYLHESRPTVIHRDLKLDNILLSTAKVAHADAKIADFGLARPPPNEPRAGSFKRTFSSRTECSDSAKLDSSSSDMSPLASGGVDAALVPRPALFLGGGAAVAAADSPLAADMKELTGCTGSYGYMAPEVLHNLQYNSACDIFSLGMCMHNLFARLIPSFQIMLNGGADELEQYAAKVAEGYRPPLPPGLPAKLAAAIEACWKGDPELRPTARQVVEMLKAVEASGELEPSAWPHAGGAALDCSRCCTIM